MRRTAEIALLSLLVAMAWAQLPVVPPESGPRPFTGAETTPLVTAEPSSPAEPEPTAESASPAEPASPLPAGFQPLTTVEAEQYDLRLAVQGDLPLSLVFAASSPSQGYQLDLNPRGSKLRRLDDLAGDIARGPGLPAVKELTIRRRDTMLYILADGRRLLGAMDSTATSGAVGWKVPAPPVAAAATTAEAPPAPAASAQPQMPAAVAEPLVVSLVENGVQPTETLYFTDDFMRTADQQELGVWQHGAGKWRFYSVMETNPKADTRLSVNPFSLGLTPEGEAPATVFAGRSDWDDYELGVSVKATADQRAGIIFGARTPTDFWLLRADLSGWPPEPRRIELVRVEGATETVVAGGTTLLSINQWYRLGVRLRGDRLQCLLDEDPIFERRDPALAGGSIGLWAAPLAGGQPAEVLFDDVSCQTNFDWQLTTAADLRATGQSLLGDWQIGQDPSTDQAGHAILASQSAQTSRYLLGDPAGGAWRLDTTVTPTQAGWFGLLFGWRDEANYSAAVWSKQGQLEIVDVVDGQRSIRAATTDSLRWGEANPVALDLLTDGRLQVRHGDALVLRCPSGPPPAGRLGVTSSGATGSFDDLRLRGWVPTETEVPVDNAVFAADPYMLNWASTLADWYPAGGPENNPAWSAPPRDPEDQAAAEEANPGARRLRQRRRAAAQAAPPGTPEQFWHKGDFLGAYLLTVPVHKGSLAVLLNAAEEQWEPVVNDAADGAKVVEPGQADGYVLTFNDTGEASTLKLWRGGQELASAALPADAAEVEIGRDGQITWVAFNDTDLICYHDQQPPRGTRVALWTNHPGALWDVRCQRDGVFDEVFERAPADWLLQGDWIITNRFSCTPTWSHMTGLARGGLAALWSKFGYSGPVTVEYYAGMRMQSDLAYYYPRVGDFNVSFDCPPFDLAGGISLIPAAWDPAWSGTYTRFARGDETIVETDRPLAPNTREDAGSRQIPVPYVASGRDVHGAWYYMKSRLYGAKLEGYFDNVKVLEAPAPTAAGDRLAFWTQDDQIVLSRVRVTYTKKEVPKRLLSSDPIAAPPAGAPSLVATLAGPAAVSFDWRGSAQGWSKRSALSSVTLEPRTADGRSYLLVTNHLPGDSFEAVMPVDYTPSATSDAWLGIRLLPSTPSGETPKWARRLADGAIDQAPNTGPGLDLTRAGDLTFNLALSPEAKVNLYLTVIANGQEQEVFVPLSGPTTSGPLLAQLWAPETPIKADGTWQSVRVPLSSALRRLFGHGPLSLSALSLGNRHEGYLRAGFGGNPRGAWYGLANFQLAGASAPGEALLPLLRVINPPASPSLEVAAVRASVDQQPDSLPPDPTDQPLTAPSEPGLYYLHLQGVLPNQAVTTAAHLPLLVVAPNGGLQALDSDQPWGGQPLAFAMGHQAPAEVALTLDNASASWGGGLRVEAEPGRLLVWPPADLVVADGATVKGTLTTRQMTGEAQTVEFTRTYQRSADNIPPTKPVITGLGQELLPERAPSSLVNTGQAVTATYQAGQGYRPEDGALTLTNRRLASSMAYSLLSGELNVGQTPQLWLDYRMPKPLRADFTVVGSVGSASVVLADGSGSPPAIGTTPEVARDGQWHRAVVPLRSFVARRTDYLPTRHRLASIGLADGGYSGAAPGAQYQIGAARLVKVVSAAAGFTIGWSASDVGGLSGWRYGLSSDETAAPALPVGIGTTQVTIRDAAEGLQWFSVQAIDAAGNVGPVARQPLLVDNTPPAWGAPSPAPGPLGSSSLTLAASGVGEADLDPAETTLSVDGTAVPLRQGTIIEQRRDRGLRWNWAQGVPRFGQPVTDGGPVKLALSAKDYAGNGPVQGAWDYQVSYAADKEAPPAPEVTIGDQPLLGEVQTFNEAAGGKLPRASSWRGAQQIVLDDQRGDAVAQIQVGAGGVPLRVGAYDLDAYPYLSFDLKAQDKVKLHLLLYLNGSWQAIELTGKSSSYPEIAKAEIVTDDQWHTFLYDVKALVRETVKEGPIKVTYVVLGDDGSEGGASYSIDNVAVFGPQPKREVKASWQAYDATGIAGASAALEAGLGGGAALAADGTTREATLTGAAAGPHLVRVRVRDGAGNLSGEARRVVVLP